MSGVAIAQAIPIICSPILSRLFTPNDFGLFADFLAIAAFLPIIMSGRYEFAILLPKRDQEAINILSLSCILTVCFFLIFFLILLGFGNSIAELINVNKLAPYMCLIPISALLSTVFLVFNEWCIRKKWFVALGKNKISNSAGIAGTSILFGLTKLQPGLILGEIFGQIFSATSAIVRVLRKDRYLFAYVTKNKMKYFARRYFDYPKFIIPGQFLNTFGGQLPVLVLSSQFGLYEAGLFMMSQRVLGIPITFFGNSFKDVFKQRAAHDFQAHGNCVNIFKKTTFLLIKIALIPFIVLFITAPYFFEFVFGAEWYDAGIYTRYLCVMYLIIFINSPTSSILRIVEKQYVDMIWQACYAVLTAVSLLAGVILKDIKITLLLLCICRSIAYLISIYLSYRYAKGNLE